MTTTKAQRQAWREKQRQENRCLRCGKDAKLGYGFCQGCLDLRQAKKHAAYQARKDRGVCTACGLVPPATGKVKCQACLDAGNTEANRSKSQKYRLKLRADVLQGYGAKCACCGESQPMFLDVDHVNNNGNTDRRVNRRYTHSLYRDLREENYPSDYQLLCRNCNWGKHVNKGVCPHQESKE